MLRFTILAMVCLALPLAAADSNQLSPAEKSAGWVLLFDGKSLDGWDGDSEVWSVRDGMIVGSTDAKTIEANTFLIYQKGKFSDFVLEADIKLRNHNTGIQFRSEREPNWVVKGYQADAAAGNWWGSLYGEKTGRGVIVNGWKGKGETVVKDGDWNHVQISCKGDRITIKLNGLTTVELQDAHEDAASEGIVALQVHRGPPMQVAFRNLKLKRL